MLTFFPFQLFKFRLFFCPFKLFCFSILKLWHELTQITTIPVSTLKKFPRKQRNCHNSFHDCVGFRKCKLESVATIAGYNFVIMSYPFSLRTFCIIHSQNMVVVYLFRCLTQNLESDYIQNTETVKVIKTNKKRRRIHTCI